MTWIVSIPGALTRATRRDWAVGRAHAHSYVRTHVHAHACPVDGVVEQRRSPLTFAEDVPMSPGRVTLESCVRRETCSSGIRPTRDERAAASAPRWKGKEVSHVHSFSFHCLRSSGSTRLVSRGIYTLYKKIIKNKFYKL